MENFTREIYGFLESCGLFIYKVRSGDGFESVSVKPMIRETPRPILLLGIVAESPKDAYTQQIGATEEASRLHRETGHYPLIVTEDRWRRQNEAMRQRILSHFDIFTQIYARNCEIRRIDKNTAQAFLEQNHSYADAACRYRYGIFLKRHTGHNALIAGSTTSLPAQTGTSPLPSGTLVAVATFSNARKWVKEGRTIRSYEWVRFASLPGLRISGGMGKILKTFIEEVKPDDIMSYADLEWSAGDVYRQLGFELEGQKAPVLFTIDTGTWRRAPVKSGAGDAGALSSVETYFQNFGSNKYRLKLTEY